MENISLESLVIGFLLVFAHKAESFGYNHKDESLCNWLMSHTREEIKEMSNKLIQAVEDNGEFSSIYEKIITELP